MKVSVRMTEIRLPSNGLVVILNSILFKNPVEILTNRKQRRVAIVVDVADGENVKEAVKVIREALRHCKSVDTYEDIHIFPNAFGSSSIDIEVAWWRIQYRLMCVGREEKLSQPFKKPWMMQALPFFIELLRLRNRSKQRC